MSTIHLNLNDIHFRLANGNSIEAGNFANTYQHLYEYGGFYTSKTILTDRMIFNPLIENFDKINKNRRVV